ncbi:hypothetical protein D9M71_693940 [compost metagenome]
MRVTLRQMEQAGLEGQQQFLMVARAFREQDQRITGVQRVVQRLQRIAFAFVAVTLDQHRIEALVGDDLADALAPVIARGDRAGVFAQRWWQR